MKAVKKKKKSIFLRIALFAFSMYTIVTLIQLQLQISEKKEESASYDKKMADELREQEILEEQINHIDDYLERKARERGYARPGESIIVEIPGKKD